MTNQAAAELFKGNETTIFVFGSKDLPKTVKAVLVKDGEGRKVIYRSDGRAFLCKQSNFLLFLDGKFEKMTNGLDVEIKPFNELEKQFFSERGVEGIAIHSGNEIHILDSWEDFYLDYPLCCLSDRIFDFAYVVDGKVKERIRNGWVIDQAKFLSLLLGKHPLKGGTLEVKVDDWQVRILRVIYKEEQIDGKRIFNAVSAFSIEELLDFLSDYPEVVDYFYKIAEQARV
ncbi:hypothetical protein [Paenibacillus dendritiformis]|uniref:hypothetical protein n=1 Tax=Paenibacillus dendritiformis TaxID=130049 RepID=UPI000DA92212|nr:hypothetical protein [Paenibacillus dendritiformis]PZM63723.1 hypothetical protein DOE73_20570 [Paenibacillus dendritiformis]